MEFVFLGHASWHLTLGELRVLFDPLLAGVHHGGVFEVHPRRRLVAEALEPDFIVVSHRHPDHFDVDSLAELARLDPDTAVLTSDELVEETATALGFSSVRRLQAFDRVTLATGELLTTPSYGTEVEWGVMVHHEGALAFNQIDTVSGGSERLAETLAIVARTFGRPVQAVPDLGLVRWQPLLEIEAQIGGPTAFPLKSYAALLDELAVLAPRTLVPSSAGSRHREPHAAMNGIVYPQTEARFLADVARRVPGTRVLPAELGGRYRVEPGGAELVGSLPELLELEASADDRVFRPFELPALADPIADPAIEAHSFAELERWVKGELAHALERAYPSFAAERTLSFALEIVGPTHARSWTLFVNERGVRIERQLDPDYDALVAIPASELRAVLAGEKSWAEPLLAGLLRSSLRAYSVDAGGTRALSVGVPFLYYALSYDESVVRATRRRVATWTSSAVRPGSRS